MFTWRQFLQLTPATKAKIKDLGHAPFDLVISQSSSSRIQTYMSKLFLQYMLNLSGGVSVLQEILSYILSLII